MKTAKYRCECGHVWEQEIAPELDLYHSDECPECASLYFKWTNYSQDFAK